MNMNGALLESMATYTDYRLQGLREELWFDTGDRTQRDIAHGLSWHLLYSSMPPLIVEGCRTLSDAGLDNVYSL